MPSVMFTALAVPTIAITASGKISQGVTGSRCCCTPSTVASQATGIASTSWIGNLSRVFQALSGPLAIIRHLRHGRVPGNTSAAPLRPNAKLAESFRDPGQKPPVRLGHDAVAQLGRAALAAPCKLDDADGDRLRRFGVTVELECLADVR